MSIVIIFFTKNNGEKLVRDVVDVVDVVDIVDIVDIVAMMLRDKVIRRLEVKNESYPVK